jgi:hypothetical protein
MIVRCTEDGAHRDASNCPDHISHGLIDISHKNKILSIKENLLFTGVVFTGIINDIYRDY